MHLCFAIPWRTRWKPFAMFFHMIWTHVRLSFLHYSWSFVCVSFLVITWLLSPYCQDYVFYAHVLSSLIPALNAFHRWSRLWWCMSPQKLFFCYHLPTRGRAGVKLGDAWCISNVSIIFDAPCLFIHHLLCVLLHFVVFLCIFQNLPINKMPQCQFPIFCCFCVSEKLHRKYSRNWTKQKPNLLFLPKLREDRLWDGGGLGARLTTRGRDPAPGRAAPWWGQLAPPPTMSFRL
jgi:hypothetical protein